jgi:hypothetical protein
MGDLVFDVTFKDGPWTSYYIGMSGAEAAKMRIRHPDARIIPRKLLPCAQRPATARIATPSPAGPSPATGRGGDL